MAKTPKDRNELPDDVKTRIAIELACFQSPSAVAATVKKEFDLDVPRQNIEAYDPEKVAGKALSKHWRALFAEARELYLSKTAGIGIANRIYRYRKLQELYDRHEVRMPIFAAGLLEQAAKEEGGAYTNRRQLEHDVTNPLRELLGQIGGTAFRPTEGPTKAK
jgi:hypothetical protein